MPRSNRWSMIAMFLLCATLAGCASSNKVPRVLWPPPPNQPRLEWIGTYASEEDFPKTALQQKMQAALGQPPMTAFKTPFGIAGNGKGLVYVSDVHLQNVRVFDFNSHQVNFLAKSPIFQLPLGMAVDSTGRLYVADGKRRTVFVFGQTGEPLGRIGGEDQLVKPAFVALNEKLGRLYVTDSKGEKIVVFDLQGKHLFSFGEPGRAEGALHGPQGLAIDGEGRVFVADMLNARVQVFDSEGQFLYLFGQRGDQAGQFESPKGVAFDSDGNLYITDSRRPYVSTFSPKGELLLITGSAKATKHKLGFAFPSTVYIDQTDRIYVADSLNKRFAIWQYLSEGYLQQHPITGEDLEVIKNNIKK